MMQVGGRFALQDVWMLSIATCESNGEADWQFALASAVSQSARGSFLRRLRYVFVISKSTEATTVRASQSQVLQF